MRGNAPAVGGSLLENRFFVPREYASRHEGEPLGGAKLLRKLVILSEAKDQVVTQASQST
jgi:hypothetical protein